MNLATRTRGSTRVGRAGQASIDRMSIAETESGKRDRERAALSVRALHRHASAEPLEQLPRDAEPESRAAELARARLVDLPEVLPDRLEVVGADADAGVDDVDPYTAAGRTVARIVTPPLVVNFTAFDSRLSSTCFTFVRSVCSARRLGRDVGHELQLLLAHHRLDLLRRPRARRRACAPPDVQRHLARLDLREVEDVVDQREQMLGGGASAGSPSRCFGVISPSTRSSSSAV